MPGFKPETWNPIVGCSKVSPGCDNCYAEKFAFRIINMLEKSKSETYHVYQNAANKQGWTGRTALNTDHIDKPLKWKEPRMIFVCSMGDLFHENVPFSWIDKVFDIIHDCSEHIFIILTKRPERMKEYMDYRVKSDKYYGHSWVWLGVTAENQEQADLRIPILLSIPAAKRFVSIEPMLGPVSFRWFNLSKEWYHNKIETNHSVGHLDALKLLDWVICGGESGYKARPMHPDWVRSVRNQCKAAGTPFFFKQWGEWLPVSTADGKQYLPFADYIPDTKFGFKRKRPQYKTDVLDGQQHHEWPKINL